MHKGPSDAKYHNAWSELGSVDEHEYAAELIICKYSHAVRVPAVNNQPQYAKYWFR